MISDIKLKEIADSLYSSFLARDFFAKILPGSLILGSTIIIVHGNLSTLWIFSLKELPLLVWLLIFGICWVLGFTVQAIGEFLRIYKAHPRDESQSDFHDRLDQFRAVKPDLADKVQRERYVVIKEVTGNMSMAIAISGIAIGLKYPQLHVAAFITSVVVSTVVLWWYNKEHAKRQRECEVRIIARYETQNTAEIDRLSED